MRLSALVSSFVVLLAMADGAVAGWGGGRTASGGHPYHNGYLFVPPASAYEAVRVRPPMWYGMPAYYAPESYLPPAFATYPTPTLHPSVPWGRAGGYYMSAQGYYYAYPY